MKFVLALCIVCAAPGFALCEDRIPIPWREFKTLYREKIERDLKKDKPASPPPWRYVLQRAEYTIRISENHAEGTISIRGTPVYGPISPIGLLDDRVILAAIHELKGGTLLSSGKRGNPVEFLPGSMEPFHICLSFLHPVREDARSQKVEIKIPRALRNSLTLDIEEGLRLEEAPGLSTDGTTRYFSATDTLTIRFTKSETDVARLQRSAFAEMHTLTSLQVHEERIIATTWFAPSPGDTSEFRLSLPPAFQFMGSSLRDSWIEKAPGGVRLHLPKNFREIFSIQYSLPRPEKGPYSLRLPSVDNNTAREGDFWIIPPEGAQIQLAPESPARRVPVSAIHESFAPVFPKGASLRNASPDKPLRIRVQPYASVKAATTVLDRIECYTSFEENGGVMSVLRFELPSSLGSQIVMQSVPDAEIWSYEVNGEPKSVYTQTTGQWILPLSTDAETSRIVLALLRRGRKLGLQGKLAARIPAIGLSVRKVLIGIALPKRVELINVDGPVTPNSFESVTPPAEFVGRPYYFSRSFHRGESIEMTLQYKEPIEKRKVSP